MTRMNYLTPKDIADFRKEYHADMGHLTDDQIIDVLGEQSHLISLARDWGWNETQVRDDSAALFVQAGLYKDSSV